MQSSCNVSHGHSVSMHFIINVYIGLNFLNTEPDRGFIFYL